MIRSAAHILVVDDEPLVRADLRQGFEDAGFHVSEAADTAGVLACLAQDATLDLITLDLMLGNENGLDIAREIRALRNVPVIMITACAEPIDRVTGLEHGADDYIAKPFNMREVVLRTHTVLRRYGRDGVEAGHVGHASDLQDVSAAECYVCTVGVVDVRRREIMMHNGMPLRLTDAEFDILLIFLRNPARVMSRDELSLQLRGRSWTPEDRTLDGHIARLRKKIEPDAGEPQLIKTVWRVGYVFTGEVQRLG